MTHANETAYRAPAVVKAFALMEEVAKEPGRLGISELARRLGLPKSTVHGLVRVLLEQEALVRGPDHRGFRLGPRLYRLGRVAAVNLSLEALVQPYLEALSRELEETVFLGTCNGQGITITAKADSPKEFKLTAPVGTKLPLLAGATAKVFLSTRDEKEVAALLTEKPLPRFTEHSITDSQEFLRQVREAREKGYALDCEEYLRGVNAVCVLLPLAGRTQPSALWVVGFSRSLTPEKMQQAVAAGKRVADELRQLTFV